MLSVTLAHSRHEPRHYWFNPRARSNDQAVRFDVHAHTPANGRFG